MTYLQLHLYELKYNFFVLLITFFYLFIISYYFSDQLIYLLVKNLLNKNMLKYFIFTNITEIFITNILISFFISIFILIQISILLFWFFLERGLYKFENYFFCKFYCFFFFFNLLIIKLILIYIIPNFWFFLLNLNFSNIYILTIYFEPKINNYFDFIFSSFSCIYLFFFILFFISSIIFNNFFQLKIVINLRKFFYLKLLFLSALITPPEIFNFLFIYFCFILFFEIIIYCLLYLNKYKLKYIFDKI